MFVKNVIEEWMGEAHKEKIVSQRCRFGAKKIEKKKQIERKGQR